MITEGDITRIVQRVASRYSPVVVGVFGSYAIGRAHEASDLDLIVIKEPPLGGRARRQVVLSLLFGVMCHRRPSGLHAGRV